MASKRIRDCVIRSLPMTRLILLYIAAILLARADH